VEGAIPRPVLTRPVNEAQCAVEAPQKHSTSVSDEKAQELGYTLKRNVAGPHDLDVLALQSAEQHLCRWRSRMTGPNVLGTHADFLRTERRPAGGYDV
jgi:hypothetical protein